MKRIIYLVFVVSIGFFDHVEVYGQQQIKKPGQDTTDLIKEATMMLFIQYQVQNTLLLKTTKTQEKNSRN